MKLAYFTSSYPRATDTFIRREINGLRARGFEVSTYSIHKPGPDHDVDDEVVREKQSTRYLLPVNYLSLFTGVLAVVIFSPLRFLKTLRIAFITSQPGIRGHALQMAYLLEAILLSSLLKKDRIEHIHNHLGDSSGNVTLFTALICDIDFSISIHGPHIFFDGHNWALDYKTRYAKFIACIGFYCRSQLMLYIEKEYWQKLKIVRCGINPDTFEYKRPGPKAETLLYVGRLDVEKGIPVLFSSMSILKERGYHLKLTLLGDGPDRNYLESLANDLEISDWVNFQGFVGQDVVVDTLIKSDIFLLPSFAEGIPVSLMEAMASGVPVVATNVGGVSELVVDKMTGLVVSPSDEIGLANAVASYVDHPTWCQEISEKARNKVTSEFCIEDQVDKLAKLFRSSEEQSR